MTVAGRPSLAARLLAGFSLVVLAAHFYRAGALLPAVACIAAITLVVFAGPVTTRILQVMLVLGALEWLHTAWVLARFRAAMGQPYLRMLAILGTVALVTGVAAWWVGRRSGSDAIVRQD